MLYVTRVDFYFRGLVYRAALIFMDYFSLVIFFRSTESITRSFIFYVITVRVSACSVYVCMYACVCP